MRDVSSFEQRRRSNKWRRVVLKGNCLCAGIASDKYVPDHTREIIRRPRDSGALWILSAMVVNGDDSRKSLRLPLALTVSNNQLLSVS